MMKDEIRAALTGALWFAVALVLVSLIKASATQGAFTSAHVALSLVLLGLAVGATVFLLRWKGQPAEQAKMKRQQMDSFLQSMSDEDLLALKRRLASVEDGEVSFVDYLGDDGELLLRD